MQINTLYYVKQGCAIPVLEVHSCHSRFNRSYLGVWRRFHWFNETISNGAGTKTRTGRASFGHSCCN